MVTELASCRECSSVPLHIQHQQSLPRASASGKPKIFACKAKLQERLPLGCLMGQQRDTVGRLNIRYTDSCKANAEHAICCRGIAVLLLL